MPTKSEDIAARIATIEAKLNEIPKATVTWKALYSSLGVFAAIVLGVTGFFYTRMLPDKVELGISNSPSLSKSFVAVDKQFDSLVEKVDKLQVTVSSTMNPKIVAAAIKDATSGDKVSLIRTLPNARKLLTIAREMKVPLTEKEYKEISAPLFSQYVSARDSFKQELWSTFLELAHTRTSTDALLHPVSEEEVARAKASNNYFEGAEIDLSTRETWKDTIFKNCQIRISNPGNNLILDHVRFIDDEFNSVAENETSRKLFQSLLESDSPSVTKKVAVFTVTVDKPILGSTPTAK